MQYQKDIKDIFNKKHAVCEVYTTKIFDTKDLRKRIPERQPYVMKQ